MNRHRWTRPRSRDCGLSGSSSRYATRKKAGHKVQAALNTVRDIAISDDTVAFAFGANNFTCDMIAKPETLSQVTEVLGEFMGRPVKLECQMGEQAKVVNRLRSAAQQAENQRPDPLVEYAVTNLRGRGGRIGVHDGMIMQDFLCHS